MLAPIAWRTPPMHYGPWELVTSLLTEGLVARGIEVTLFATLDSQTSATLDGVSPHGYAEDPSMDGRVWEAMHVAFALARSKEFDLVHNQLDWLPLAFAEHCDAPMVTTIHGFSGAGILPAYVHAARPTSRSPTPTAPPTSTTSRRSITASTSTALPFRPTPGDDLAAFGRIHPDKGTADAIAIAREPVDAWSSAASSRTSGTSPSRSSRTSTATGSVFLGSVGPRARAEVLGGAAALLHPIAFDEPFGLSVVEAMACGTPVVAYRRGSMPEVIDEGVTGYLATDVPRRWPASRRPCGSTAAAVRTRAAARFGVDRMVDDYVRVYRQISRRVTGVISREQLRDRRPDHADARVADAVRQPQPPVMDEPAARIHDVGHVALALVQSVAQQGFVEPSEHPGRVVEVEQQRTDRVGAHRPDPVRQHQPALLGLEGRPAVADLQDLPRRLSAPG